jgi:8-amino-7-oxononanoate synthase
MLPRSRFQSFVEMVEQGKQGGYYPFFRPLAESWGPEVVVDGQRLVMVGSNDYLGLSHDPRVVAAAQEAAQRWGAGPGGSRFLCGNTTLHENLEERLAAFVGKKKAVVHTTGFTANSGALHCLAATPDVLLCDSESHASLVDGCLFSRGRLLTFRHNRADAARAKLEAAQEKNPEACFLVTEGVFSMSGDVAALPELLALKRDHPNLVMYLDDAHGLGVMGRNGRGTADHFGVTTGVDFLMGTFSKALASIGGFIASDDTDALTYIRHQSRPLIFSAALPASCAAAALASLAILEQEPERIERLRTNTRMAVEGYGRIGLATRCSGSPILPIGVGSEMKAYQLSRELFEQGVFALPAVFPAVPRGQAIIRTAYMSTHEPRHIEKVLTVLESLADRHGIRRADLEREPVTVG